MVYSALPSETALITTLLPEEFALIVATAVSELSADSMVHPVKSALSVLYPIISSPSSPYTGTDIARVFDSSLFNPSCFFAPVSMVILWTVLSDTADSTVLFSYEPSSAFTSDAGKIKHQSAINTDNTDNIIRCLFFSSFNKISCLLIKHILNTFNSYLSGLHYTVFSEISFSFMGSLPDLGLHYTLRIKIICLSVYPCDSGSSVSRVRVQIVGIASNASLP